ncbi:hypothetical protein C772_00894 [Bhargavaea cecembensis DSE10]|uniref:Uncharacterized protein n=1 Tax=Bhargavaea cecembensis DSE10 TaxID=1235279 RepID=M7P9T6_9BACL|nr:hypothetical protein C772_00894 [Bhargavaea cecembensis DSE10]
MEHQNKSFSLADIHTGYYVFFGAVGGAVLGLLAYVNDWL